MKSKERFPRELVVQANRNLYRTERPASKERGTVITASSKSGKEIRTAFRDAALKLKTG